MQLTKAYSGSVTLSSEVTREASYKGTATTKEYPERLDFVNGAAASFLKDECGVDAAYEVRDGSTQKYLWIYGVPFLLNTNHASSNDFFGPGSTTYMGYMNGAYFSDDDTGDYSFSFNFAGSAESGFALRVKPYGSSAIANYGLCIFPCVSTVNGRDAVVWITTLQADALGIAEKANGVELVNGVMDWSTYNANTLLPFCMAAIGRTEFLKTNENKFPLLPVFVGVWQAKGLYRFITNYGIPAAAGFTVEAQTEFTAGDRTFINTVAETPVNAYINLGLIDVTGT